MFHVCFVCSECSQLYVTLSQLDVEMVMLLLFTACYYMKTDKLVLYASGCTCVVFCGVNLIMFLLHSLKTIQHYHQLEVFLKVLLHYGIRKEQLIISKIALVMFALSPAIALLLLMHANKYYGFGASQATQSLLWKIIGFGTMKYYYNLFFLLIVPCETLIVIFSLPRRANSHLNVVCGCAVCHAVRRRSVHKCF